jgi:hypothetical protein
MVSTSVSTDEPLALLRAGAGVLFQAVLDGRVRLSAVVLLSGRKRVESFREVIAPAICARVGAIGFIPATERA